MMLFSCSAIKLVSTNPKPNLKTVHFVLDHDWNYTERDYELHPDWDCFGQFLTKAELNTIQNKLSVDNIDDNKNK